MRHQSVTDQSIHPSIHTSTRRTMRVIESCARNWKPEVQTAKKKQKANMRTDGQRDRQAAIPNHTSGTGNKESDERPCQFVSYRWIGGDNGGWIWGTVYFDLASIVSCCRVTVIDKRVMNRQPNLLFPKIYRGKEHMDKNIFESRQIIKKIYEVGSDRLMGIHL